MHDGTGGSVVRKFTQSQSRSQIEQRIQSLDRQPRPVRSIDLVWDLHACSTRCDATKKAEDTVELQAAGVE